MSGRGLTQIIETPDGQQYFAVSRTVRQVSGLLASQDDELVIGLGCDLRYAPLVLSAGRPTA